MKADELRALQAPLKARYKEDPAAGRLTLVARGRLGLDDVTCTIETGHGRVTAGLHPATGGDGSKACSGDMLLEALVGCAGVTLAAVATAIGVEIRGGTLTAEGDMDFRGTLGVAKDAPVGFTAVRLAIELDTDAPQEKLDQLKKLAERYCVVYQTLAAPPSIAVAMSRTT